MAPCCIAVTDLPILTLSAIGFRCVNNAWRVSKGQKDVDALAQLDLVDQDILLLDRTERDQNSSVFIPLNAQAIESLVHVLKRHVEQFVVEGHV